MLALQAIGPTGALCPPFVHTHKSLILDLNLPRHQVCLISFSHLFSSYKVTTSFSLNLSNNWSNLAIFRFSSGNFEYACNAYVYRSHRIQLSKRNIDLQREECSGQFTLEIIAGPQLNNLVLNWSPKLSASMVPDAAYSATIRCTVSETLEDCSLRFS